MQDWSRNINCIVAETRPHHTHQSEAQLKVNVAVSVDENMQPWEDTLAPEPHELTSKPDTTDTWVGDLRKVV